MKYRLHIFWQVVIILAVFISCIDENITNISDSLELNQSYSLPVGDVSYTINDYFATLDTLQFDTIQADTLQIDTLISPLPDTIDLVEFNDTLYTNVKYLLDTTIDTEFDFGELNEDLDKIINQKNGVFTYGEYDEERYKFEEEAKKRSDAVDKKSKEYVDNLLKRK